MEISEYEETYKEMFRPLLTFCGKKYFGIDNESVVQQAFLALWNKKHQINDNKKFLFRVVHNIAKTAVRSRIRQMERQNVFLSLNDYAHTISEKELFLDKLSLQGTEKSLFDMVFMQQLKQQSLDEKQNIS
jgi:DNA-directed RNA polymerase specialized sigma24 family protein